VAVIRPVGNLAQPSRNVRLRARVAAAGDADEAVEPLTEVHREDPQHAAETARGAELEDLREARDGAGEARVPRREAARRALASRAALLEAQGRAPSRNDGNQGDHGDDDGLDANAVRALRAYARSLDADPRFKTKV